MGRSEPGAYGTAGDVVVVFSNTYYLLPLSTSSSAIKCALGCEDMLFAYVG